MIFIFSILPSSQGKSQCFVCKIYLIHCKYYAFIFAWEDGRITLYSYCVRICLRMRIIYTYILPSSQVYKKVWDYGSLKLLACSLELGAWEDSHE